MVTLKPVNVSRWTAAEDGRDSTLLADRREQARRSLLERAALLPNADRLLLEMVYSDGLPHRRVARVLNLPAGSVSRRARQLFRRLYSPFVSALVQSGEQLSAQQRQIAAQVYISRRGIASVAAGLGVSRTEAVRATAFVFGWYRGLTGKSPS